MSDTVLSTEIKKEKDEHGMVSTPWCTVLCLAACKYIILFLSSLELQKIDTISPILQVIKLQQKYHLPRITFLVEPRW